MNSDYIYSKSEIKDIVKQIAEKRNIKRVFLFGSYARNEAKASSDIDFCIDAPDVKSIFAISGIRQDLCEALEKDVDLITMSSLPYNDDKLFIESLNRDKELIYG